MICLDTNAAITLLNQKDSPIHESIRRAAAAGEVIAVSSTVLFELWFGAAKSARYEYNARRIADFCNRNITILPFDAEDAEVAGKIRVELARAGTPIGPYDLLIAAQARRRGAVLVTANGREFARVPGLKVEDWAAG